MVLESPLPHDIVNLLIQSVIVNKQLTILWKRWLYKTIFNAFCEISPGVHTAVWSDNRDSRNRERGGGGEGGKRQRGREKGRERGRHRE